MNKAAAVGALLVLAAVWFGPLPDLSASSFAAHMTMHMAVVAVAAPLAAFAVSGARLDPAHLASAWFAPIPASLIELLVVWTWHAPALHAAARESTAAFVAEQASFAIAGTWFWISVASASGKTHDERRSASLLAMLLTFAHMTLLGALLALTPRPLYHAMHGLGQSDIELLADQQLGGIIMLSVSALVYVPAGLWLTRRLLGRLQSTSEWP